MKKNSFIVYVVVISIAFAIFLSVGCPVPEEDELIINVEYKGDLTVDSLHKIYVGVYENTEDAPSSFDETPDHSDTLTSKSGSITFTDIENFPVYISVYADTSGDTTGDGKYTSGEPYGGKSVDKYGEYDLTFDN